MPNRNRAIKLHSGQNVSLASLYFRPDYLVLNRMKKFGDFGTLTHINLNLKVVKFLRIKGVFVNLLALKLAPGCLNHYFQRSD